MNSIRLTPPKHPIKASVEVPGSKSYTNRALVVAAQASGMTEIEGASDSEDSAALISALTILGLNVKKERSRILVEGGAEKISKKKSEIDVGPAGTTMRFLTSLCATIEGAEVILKGSERMHQRPIRDLVDALKSLGASIEYLGKDGCPPIRIVGRKLQGGSVQVRGDVSSQFLSSLLLIAPVLQNGLIVEIPGALVSRSYVELTLDTLRQFGIEIDSSSNQFKIAPQKCKAGRYRVEGDVSGATYLWGIAAVSGGLVEVLNINPESKQGDLGILSCFEQMGCKVSRLSPSDDRPGSVIVEGVSSLNAISVDMTLMPDAAQTLAVIGAVASGVTTLTGLGTLRHKETDRIAALQAELKALSIESSIETDSISVVGGKPQPASIKTYEDHRMAMAFAMLGSKFDGIEIQDPQVVGKSFPQFWETLAEMGIVGA